MRPPATRSLASERFHGAIRPKLTPRLHRSRASTTLFLLRKTQPRARPTGTRTHHGAHGAVRHAHGTPTAPAERTRAPRAGLAASRAGTSERARRLSPTVNHLTGRARCLVRMKTIVLGLLSLLLSLGFILVVFLRVTEPIASRASSSLDHALLLLLVVVVLFVLLLLVVVVLLVLLLLVVVLVVLCSSSSCSSCCSCSCSCCCSSSAHRARRPHAASARLRLPRPRPWLPTRSGACCAARSRPMCGSF